MVLRSYYYLLEVLLIGPFENSHIVAIVSNIQILVGFELCKLNDLIFEIESFVNESLFSRM